MLQYAIVMYIQGFVFRQEPKTQNIFNLQLYVSLKKFKTQHLRCLKLKTFVYVNVVYINARPIVFKSKLKSV